MISQYVSPFLIGIDQRRTKKVLRRAESFYLECILFWASSDKLTRLPVSQRIWTLSSSPPPRGLRPPGPDPRVDIDPLSRIWTPPPE